MKHVFMILLGASLLVLTACRNGGNSDGAIDSTHGISEMADSQDGTETGSDDTASDSNWGADSLPVFQLYGELAPDGYLDGADTITEAFGFKLDRVASCEVTQELVASVGKNNQLAMEAMNEKYGSNWQQDFTEKTGYQLSIPMRRE